MDYTILAYPAAVIDLGSGIKHRAVADLTAVADISLRIYLDPGSELDSTAYVSKSTDISVSRHFDTLGNERRRLDPDLLHL